MNKEVQTAADKLIQEIFAVKPGETVTITTDYDSNMNLTRAVADAVERAVVLLFGSYVSERELPLAVTQAYEQEDDTEPSALSVPLEGATLEDVEREAILRMLDSVGDNKSEAAKRLGISRKTLHTKLKRYGQEQD